MPLYHDQLNRPVTIPTSPQRIISLVPSQTELLYHLGLDAEVIGITRFCMHPQHWFKSKQRVGGTKKLNRTLIDRLEPDLIIANKEENKKQDIEQLQSSWPVFVTDVNDLSSAYEMIEQIGLITNRHEKALSLTRDIQRKFSALEIRQVNKEKAVLYLIWKEPYMAAGTGTFISHLLSVCGFRNFIEEPRYPTLDISELTSKTPPDLIFLSSEPYPFREQHANQFKQLFPSSKVFCVDGEMFSWYGSRLLHSAEYFRGFLNDLDQDGVI